MSLSNGGMNTFLPQSIVRIRIHLQNFQLTANGASQSRKSAFSVMWAVHELGLAAEKCATEATGFRPSTWHAALQD